MAENENIEEMMSLENENNRKWYYRTFLEFERKSIKNKYFNFLNEVKTDVPFFRWFEGAYNFKIPKIRKIWVKQENIKVNYEKNNSQIVQPTYDNIPYESISCDKSVLAAKPNNEVNRSIQLNFFF